MHAPIGFITLVIIPKHNRENVSCCTGFISKIVWDGALDVDVVRSSIFTFTLQACGRGVGVAVRGFFAAYCSPEGKLLSSLFALRAVRHSEAEQPRGGVAEWLNAAVSKTV